MYGLVLATAPPAGSSCGWRKPDVLPIVAAPLAETIDGYVKELVKLGDTERERSTRSNQRLKDRTYQLAADPTKVSVPPPTAAPGAVPESSRRCQNAVGPAHDGRRARLDAAVADPKNASRLASAESAARLDAVLTRHRPGLLQRGGAASPPVVPAPDLRARLLHRLRREDRSRRPRSHRAAHVEGGRRRGRPGR